MARTAQRSEQREIQGERLQRQPRVVDRFHIDPGMIPDGVSYEWKRHSVFGQEDRQHQIFLARNHWRPVPAGRHPELSGAMDPNDTTAIIIDGLILMERPAYLTDEARIEDKIAADSQVKHQIIRLNQGPTGTGPRDVDARTAPDIRRSYERMEVPNDE